MTEMNYHFYRQCGHGPWTAFVLGTPIWLWLVVFPVLANVVYWLPIR